jgi:hypothetical protein
MRRLYHWSIKPIHLFTEASFRTTMGWALDRSSSVSGYGCTKQKRLSLSLGLLPRNVLERRNRGRRQLARRNCCLSASRLYRDTRGTAERRLGRSKELLGWAAWGLVGCLRLYLLFQYQYQIFLLNDHSAWRAHSLMPEVCV